MDRPTATDWLAGLVSWGAEYALCLRIDKRAFYGLRVTRSTRTSILLIDDDSLMCLAGSINLENSVWSHPFAAPDYSVRLCGGERATMMAKLGLE